MVPVSTTPSQPVAKSVFLMIGMSFSRCNCRPSLHVLIDGIGIVPTTPSKVLGTRLPTKAMTLEPKPRPPLTEPTRRASLRSLVGAEHAVLRIHYPFGLMDNVYGACLWITRIVVSVVVCCMYSHACSLWFSFCCRVVEKSISVLNVCDCGP